jgi:hypothetical protein
MRTNLVPAIKVLLASTSLILAWPQAADAQRRPPPGRYEWFSVQVRIDAQPVEAEVYVNGHFAGEVDDFDGVMQRLRLQPGEHEIVLYLDGYQTIRERRYFNPDSRHTLRFTMRPLAPGEPQEPRPTPGGMPPPLNRADSPRAAPPPRPVEQPAPSGTLSIHVEPADAQILIDGQPWSGDASKMPIPIGLSTGRHTLEVRKDGYKPYLQDVLISRDRTLSLDVVLTR